MKSTSHQANGPTSFILPSTLQRVFEAARPKPILRDSVQKHDRMAQQHYY
jgi:hypothetical protein